jgi:hypothetical protein
VRVYAAGFFKTFIMKKILSLIIITFFAIGVYAQPGYLERRTRDHVIATMSDSSTHVPAFDRPRLGNGTGARAGALIVDSTGGGRGLYYSPGGGVLIRVRDTTEVGGNTSNGIRAVGDTIQIGGSIQKYNYIYTPVNQKNGTIFGHVLYGNQVEANSVNGVVDPHLTVNTYNPSTLGVQRVFKEVNADTDSLQYGGAISLLSRREYDSASTLFKEGARSIWLSSEGTESVYQFFPPRDSTVWKIGRDGQSANTFHGQFDMGHSWGYNLNVVPESGIPEFPASIFLSSFDPIRVIDNTRRKKFVGAGISGYTSRFKSYQTSINTSTYEAGNYWSKVVGFTAYGDVYPTISGATKAKTLAVATVDTAIGFLVQPQYRYTNTIKNGYGFVAQGDSDYNHFKGFITIGGNLPTRQNAGQAFTRRLYVTGDMESTGNSYSFVSQAYGMAISIPIAIGTEAGINFTQKDSALTATIGAYLTPANRAARGLYIRSEIFNGATMDNNSTGGFVQIETGVNHANETRWWRNGNMVIKRVSGTTDVYRLYKALVVNGSPLFLDTLTVKNMISKAWDAANLKPVVVDADGNFYKTSENVVTSLTNTATLDFSNVVAQSSQDLTITVTGATAGMTVAISIPNAETPTGTCVTAWVSAADTVTVRFNNYRATDYDPGSASFTVKVFNN